jgi:hypothetical protein
MTVHRNRFLVNKTNRCTKFQLYWYYYSTRYGQPFCPSSGVLSRTSALVHFMQLLSGVGWHSHAILLLIANGSSQLHKMYQSWCTAKNSWWWAERLPVTCRVVIQIKLEFSASVGFLFTRNKLSLFYKQIYALLSVLLAVSYVPFALTECDVTTLGGWTRRFETM